MALSKFLDPKNDVSFKRIFGSEQNKDILIHFINDILSLSGSKKIKQVSFLSPMLEPEIAVKKQSIVDVLCTTAEGVQIIVEMQVAPNKGFEKRAQYYASKAYSRQLNRGQEEDGLYENLKAVIFIAITNYVVFPDKPHYISDHVILDKKDYTHDLKDFSFTFVELPKFKKTKVEDLENIVEKWCYYFKHASATTKEEFEKIIGTDTVIKQAYEQLSEFNWSEEELFAYDQELKRMRDNRAILDYAEAKGHKEGLEEGIEKGREEGLEKGREEEKTETVINLLEMKMDDDFILKATRLTQEELDKIKAKLR